MNRVSGFQAYWRASVLVGGILGGTHGHFYRAERMKEHATQNATVVIVTVVRDVCVGACLYPVLLPLYIISPVVPGLENRLNQCPFSNKPHQEN